LGTGRSIAERYARLREDLNADERDTLWHEFVEEVREAGHEEGGQWASPD
jgi:hypothetical protein